MLETGLDKPYLLHHLLARSASRRPQADAIVDGERSFPYRRLTVDVERCAAELRSAGLLRRDRVGIYLPKCYEECVAIFAASRADGVFVPINSLLKPRQVRHILTDCGARWLITDSQRHATLREALGEVPTLKRILLVDEERSAGPAVGPAFALSSDGEGWSNACVGEDLAAILYTSGSTGLPKGVMLSHRNLLAGSRIVSLYLGIRAEERILCVLPFSFDYGLNQLITAVEHGATSVLLTFRFGDEIVRAIQAHSCTALAGVPTVWTVLSQAAPSFHRTHLDTLRYFTNSGGAVPTETLQRIRTAQPHVDFFLMYGLTEAFRSTYLPPAEISKRPTSMGRAIPETEILVVQEDGAPCEPGEVGILVHRGPTVSLGYWGRPEETARVLRPHPYLPEREGGDRVCYSGDLVRMDEEGYLYFVGRGDAMIKSSGYRISPTEVEEVLMSSGNLSEAAVIGLPEPASGALVHAICVPSRGWSPQAEDLLARCARELPSHMVPRSVEFVDSLPRSPNGKVDYKTLRAQRTAREPGS